MAAHRQPAQVRDTVAVHVPCSSKKMGIEEAFTKLAGLCAKEVVPSGIPCCGMAGDRCACPAARGAAGAGSGLEGWACRATQRHRATGDPPAPKPPGETPGPAPNAPCPFSQRTAVPPQGPALHGAHRVQSAAPQPAVQLLGRVLNQPHLRDVPVQPQRHQLPGAGVPGGRGHQAQAAAGAEGVSARRRSRRGARPPTAAASGAGARGRAPRRARRRR